MPASKKAWNNKGMNRMRIFFAIVLLLLALPFWRFADMVAIASPFEWPLPFVLTLWFAVFLAIPLKLLVQKVHPLLLISLIGIFAAFAYWTSPLSKMATDDPNHNHCGGLTYTGVFYPIRTILSDAHHDDLEARNQMCWVRKMISKVPPKFDTLDEVESYSYFIREKLLRPEIKYRVALPLIGILYFTINTSAGNVVGVKQIYDSLHFWIDHYTEEIGQRDYSVWNWPHSDYIQFEYGLVERNWQEFIDSIVIEEN